MRKKASTQMNCIETINMPRIINKLMGTSPIDAANMVDLNALCS